MSPIVEPTESRNSRPAVRERAGIVPLVLAVVLLAAGCAALPTGRFDTLAAAAKGVEARTTETDAEVVQLTRRFMLFSPAPGPYTVNSFVPAVDIDGRKFDFDFGPRL
jgi:hypothetical protein